MREDRPVKNMLFTFDYELFLGKKSGSIDKCVIEPTQKLLDIFSLYKAKAIFFVDTTWLLRLKEIMPHYAQAKKDFEKVAQQLQQISKSGHYIFPHLHPHWLDAGYLPEINQWQLLNHSKYRFHNLDETRRLQLFGGSIALLKEILGKDYVPYAYRAGGWSIQPFEDFRPLFESYGTKYDFSVLPGHKCISNGQHYDFSDIKVTHPYTFLNDVTVVGKGQFIEMPISVISVPRYRILLNRVLLKYLWWSGNRSFGDGQGIQTEVIENNAGTGNEMVSIELLTSIKLPVYLNFLRRNKYMQFIAHPKMLSHHNINTFAGFIKRVFQQYSIETDFMKMSFLK